MNQEIVSIFANNLFSTRQLYQLIDQLNNLVKDLYHNKIGTINAKIDGALPANLVGLFQEIETKNLEPTGDEGQKRFLEELVAQLKKLTLAKVTLAFEPNDEFVAKLSSEITGIVGKKVIIDISVEPKIVGGLLLEYQGHYRDYSLRSKVDEFVKQRVATEIKSKLVVEDKT